MPRTRRQIGSIQRAAGVSPRATPTWRTNCTARARASALVTGVPVTTIGASGSLRRRLGGVWAAPSAVPKARRPIIRPVKWRLIMARLLRDRSGLAIAN
jgi:hypothetical protein